jgi:hypothetical protein
MAGTYVCVPIPEIANIRSKLTVDADTTADLNLLRNAFKAWRDDMVATRLEGCIDRRILRNSFSFWVIRQRGRLLERVRDHRFLQEALEIWKERLEGLHEELRPICYIIEQRRARRTLRYFLRMWRDALKFHSETKNVATVASYPGPI